MSNKRKKKKRSGKKKLILFIFEIVLLLVVLGVLWIYNSTLGKINYEDSLTTSEAGVNDDIEDDTIQTMHGYLNVALFGLDSRDMGTYDAGSNSDCIMIASLNYDTNEVQLVSVYRDTYLNIGDSKYRKANAAFASGGAEQAVKMLNSNLDLSITKYVCVDWKALIEVIDALDGIELDLTSEEVYWTNEYQNETSVKTGYKKQELSGSGKMKLNGLQAVAYTRIRYTAGDDYLRTSRQRLVLQAILDKAKQADIATLTSMCTTIMDDISTNFSAAEILGYAKNVTAYNIKATSGFPFELTTQDINSQSTVVPIDLAQNVTELHQFLFEDEEYTPSNTVEKISDTIISKTGIKEGASAVDTSKYNNTVNADGTSGVKDQNSNKSSEE